MTGFRDSAVRASRVTRFANLFRPAHRKVNPYLDRDLGRDLARRSLVHAWDVYDLSVSAGLDPALPPRPRP